MEEKSSNQKKDASSDKQAEGNAQKITNFFPLLRNEGRAKMCASKTDDSKQKELLKKIKGKESMTLRSKRLEKSNEKSTSSNSSSQAKDKIRNMSVASALKTPLSQVLRKSIEAADRKEASAKITSSESKRSLSDTESGRILRQKSTTAEKPSNAEKPSTAEKSSRTSVLRKKTESGATSGSEKTKTEGTSVQPRNRGSKAVTYADSATEEGKSEGVPSSSDNSNKVKKQPKKRHFRGSTYGLYLTPARKKKRKMKSQDESKDDDCSVTSADNNSFLDSEDANSLVSEDFFTPSEKSLAGEEQGLESQNSSTILSTGKKLDKSEINCSIESEDVNSREQALGIEKPEMKIEISADYEENTQNVTDLFQDLEEMNWESNPKPDENTNTSQKSKPPQYDDISNESYTNSLHFSFKKNSEDSKEGDTKENSDIPKETDERMLGVLDDNSDSKNKSNDKLNLQDESKAFLSINDNAFELFDLKESASVSMKEESNIGGKEDLNIDLKESLNIEMKDDSNIGGKEDLNVGMKDDSNIDTKDDEDSNVELKDDYSNMASSVGSENKDLNILTSALSEIKDEDLNLKSGDMLSSKDNLDLLFSDANTSDLITADTSEGKDLNVISSEVSEKNAFNIAVSATFDESRENSNPMTDEPGNKNLVGSLFNVPQREEVNNSNSLLAADFKQDSNSLSYAEINKQDSNSLTFTNVDKLDSNSNTFPEESKQESGFLEFSNEEKNDSNSLRFTSREEEPSGIISNNSEEKNDNVSLNLPENEAVVNLNTEGDNFDSNMEVDNMEKHENEDDQSTIATCVKSRQRIKRRFTDDIVDTDLGILSAAAMASIKKAPIKQESPREIIENFQSVTREAKKSGSAARIECVFNCKQSPINSCTCEESAIPKNEDSEEILYCAAVDTIDNKLLGCTNQVVTRNQVRASVKNVFAVMCETHLWRLRHHHACPYCGLFCSQGSFLRCTNVDNPQCVHLFHEQCQTKEEGIVPFCFHCGSVSNLKRVHLEMHMTSPPAFFLNQASKLSLPDVSKARISFSDSSDFYNKDEEEPALSYKIEESGKILSSAGLPNGSSREELEKLLCMLNDDKIRSYNFSPDELYDTAASGDVLKVLYMLVKGFDPNQKFASHEGETALHAAAAHGHETVVHLLIQAGAVNDSLNEKMYTPLMLAVENGHKEVVHYLVKKGAITDFKGENGMSSLHLAAKGGNLDVLKILMSSRDTDIDAQDDGGWTPIVWASEHDHLNVVRYLLKRGANPNLRDNEGNIGLHWSAFSGSVEISYLYLDYGCDINAVNELGDTPLHIAARQDSFPCVTLFLSRGADVTIKNKADKLPAECCIDKNSDTYLSLSLNMLLKKITKKYQHKAEKIIHRDISRGKEQLAIQCVNAVDDENPPVDFLYVTENCETMPIKIDRTITSLQSCHCEDDCSTAGCSCANISYQCWYDKEGLLVPEFNIIDPPMVFECNRACSCWSLNCHNRVLQNGITCRLQLIRTKGKGWGVRTLKDIPKGAFICEYVGELISDSAADKRSDDSYLFDLDNRDGETYCLDARYYGNISRFINHLCEPNLVPVKVYVDHQDLNFPRIAFFSSRDIKQYEELGFDYGEKFWSIKYKSFTCDCGTPKCKYSKETIHITLANYYRRMKEEQMEEAAAQPLQTVVPIL